MVVVLILALVAALASASLTGPIRRAKLTQAFDKLENVDRFVRTAARRENRAYRLFFDRKKRIIETRADRESDKKNVRTWPMPSGVEMIDFFDSDGINNSSKYEILVASNGTSPSYAVCLATKEGKKTWVMTFGLSAKQVRLEDKADVAALFDD